MRGLANSTTASYRGNLGILKLEDGNLIFVNRSGFRNQKDYVVQSIPVASIRSMNVEDAKKTLLGVQMPLLVIMVDSSKMPGIPRHEFQVVAPAQWITVIQDEMKKVPAQGAQSTQPTYVKEIVREIVKYPCPYCNALIEITASRCPSCGAPQKK